MARKNPLAVSIVGTRPEAIKMIPVIEALARQPALEQRVLITGQHGNLASTLASAPAAVEDLGLSLAEHSAGETTDAIRYAVSQLLLRTPAELVLVQGDTSSALGGALGALDAGIPVGHVEAGLRSGDPLSPWPEEQNRIHIDRCSAILFAPTTRAALNLELDALVTGNIHVTGNSGIDALLRIRGLLPPAPRRRGGRKTILVTCHRRENRGATLARILGTLSRLVRELPVRILLPLHPNEHVRREVERLVEKDRHIKLLEPQDHAGMVGLMVRCWAILTDSGGLQEEGPALGKPVLVLRDVTERPEAIASGNAELVGTDPDRIVAAIAALISDPSRYRRMARPAFPFGDGRAADRIADALIRHLVAT